MNKKGYSKEHIVQTVVGNVLTGNAGLTKKHIEESYVVMLCTMNSDKRFVDLVLTKKQVVDLSNLLKLEVDINE